MIFPILPRICQLQRLMTTGVFFFHFFGGSKPHGFEGFDPHSVLIRQGFNKGFGQMI